MKDSTMKYMDAGRKMGAAAGATLFLLVGLVPAFYLGSFGTIALLAHLTGGSVDAGIITRMIVVVGTMLGVFCAGASSIVVGAVTGTVAGYLVDAAKAVAHHEKEGEEAMAQNK